MKNILNYTKIFLNHCKYEKQLSCKTLKAYNTDLNQFSKYLSQNGLSKNLTGITKNEIKGFMKSMSGLKAKSVKRKIATLKSFYKHLEFEDHIIQNPFRKINIQIKEPRMLPVVMDIQEIHKIFKYLYSELKNHRNAGSSTFETSLRNVVVIELLFITGARVSEISNLKIDNIDLLNGNLTLLGKGNKERIIQICNPETLNILNEYACINPNKNNCFLVNRNGNKLSDQSIRNIVTNLTKAVKINKHITPHKFRHTFATLLLENDVDIKYIQSMLGHSSILTTQIYTHVNREKQRQILIIKHPRNTISFL